MKVRLIAGLTVAIIALATAVPAFASPSPPTNAGNGGGASGQCTGPVAERPGGCHTSK
jgi:hypothetical protein